jgi:hypothetical protein
MPDRLRAIKRLKYGMSLFAPGDEFIASAPDARTLVITGLALRVDETPPKAPTLAALVTRDLVAEAPAAEPPPKRKRGRPIGSGKGTYKRRDMRAE